ncbi:MAG TPA: murein peptide amidase A [Acidiferrobacteraceae bacterium]|nr:murein peptide amidase A [Acidiferrobacteraceae bacterium]
MFKTHLTWLLAWVGMVGTGVQAEGPGVCVLVAAKLASISLPECQGRRLRSSEAISVMGTPIVEKIYPPLGRRIPKARILVVGGIHGDEYASVSVVFKWMKILDRHHSGLFHWYFVPLLNPDGLLRPKSQRMNANGVDLNRNFPTPNWLAKTRHYWVKETRRNLRRYPGIAPLSEPESQWLAATIHHFRPDAIVAVHAPHGVVDYDGPPEAPRRLGYLNRNLMGTYPGSLGNYAGIQLGIPVITLELPSAGSMPTSGQIRRLWVDLVRWLRLNIPRAPKQLTHHAGPS